MRLALSLLLLSPWLAFAQEAGEKGRYVPIPFEGNLERTLRERLQYQGELSKTSDFLDLLRRNQLLDSLKRLMKNQPALFDLARRWADAAKGGLSPDERRLLEKEINQALNKPPPEPGPEGPPPRGVGARRFPPPPAPAPPSSSTEVMEATRRLIDRLERTDLADWLEKSPSWRKGVEGLERFLTERRAADSGLRMPSSLPALPEGLGRNFTTGALDRLRNLSLPALPRIQPPSVRVGGLRLPGLGRPSGPSFAWLEFSDGLIWIGLILVGLVLLWFSLPYLRRWLPGPRGGHAVPSLPIDLRDLRTREQLRAAFDRLALARLGDEARPWNHRTVALALEEFPLPADRPHLVLRELADLYESARYLPGVEELTPAEREAALRCLGLLAGARR